ncbi:hypothetical protein BCR34DRAFT_630120 [Clohesyomyces aquaticus]|uniref:Uncharacterized protein n=1 Tax=Clohesyomyces aquaticus TaxID=1231657 RepID=A0A1Y2AD26_9PLEO|nr:hypothetical protein BCR34DRAFT_630120 [Clohesyomyces aquaticus]
MATLARKLPYGQAWPVWHEVAEVERCKGARRNGRDLRVQSVPSASELHLRLDRARRLWRGKTSLLVLRSQPPGRLDSRAGGRRPASEGAAWGVVCSGTGKVKRILLDPDERVEPVSSCLLADGPGRGLWRTPSSTPGAPQGADSPPPRFRRPACAACVARRDIVGAAAWRTTSRSVAVPRTAAAEWPTPRVRAGRALNIHTISLFGHHEPRARAPRRAQSPTRSRQASDHTAFRALPFPSRPRTLQ